MSKQLRELSITVDEVEQHPFIDFMLQKWEFFTVFPVVVEVRAVNC